MTIQVPEVSITAEQSFELEGIDFITSGDQYLTFCLGNEHYGVDILAVNAIRGWDKPTLIPNAEDYVKGVINLRGVIVPIIDLRIRFSVGEATYTPTTVVIVLTDNSKQTGRTMGFVVDAVSDVLNAEESEVKKAPAFGGSLSHDFVDGLVNVGDDVVTLLNVETLLTLEESEDNGCASH